LVVAAVAAAVAVIPITQVHILGFLLAAVAVAQAVLVAQVVEAVVLDQQLLPQEPMLLDQRIFLAVVQVDPEVAVQQPLGEAADFLAAVAAVAMSQQVLAAQVLLV